MTTFRKVRELLLTSFDDGDISEDEFFTVVLPVPRLRGRLGQVRCRKASWGCFGGRSFQNGVAGVAVQGNIEGS